MQGRTGVIICSYLLHTGQFTDTKEALQFYGERRTQNAKVIVIPHSVTPLMSIIFSSTRFENI